MEITRPAGFTITGAAIVTAGSSGSATLTTTGAAKFLNLGVAPLGGITVTVTATAPCAAETYKWGIQVKQSNDFSGTGNTFAIAKTTASAVDGKVTAGQGGCSVAFIPTNEPESTVRTSAVLSGFDSTGGPVEVGAFTPSGKLATTFDGIITVKLSRNPTGAKLSGGTSVTASASGGIAEFPTGTISKLSLNAVGSGYRLKATSPGLTAIPPAPLSQFSSLFSIYTKLEKCATANCSVTGSTTKNKKTRITLTETTTSAPAGGFVGFGFGGAPTFAFGCSGTFLVTPADTAVTDVFLSTGTPTKESGAASTWRIVYEITKSIVKASGQSGASQWQVCYASTTLFKTASGVTATRYSFPTATTGVTIDYYVGLLPSCPSTIGMPCILTRHKDNAGDEIITIRASGDSYVRP
jgi:hypothetical protein